MHKNIVIKKEPTHGRRIVCACGYEDKAYTKDALGVANYHNRKVHGNKYAIDVL
jgi:hypothetical protein